ncbi:DsbA family protein [Candidatus Woesebacteria bacterium]|nr:DsbA family protein [Candidatus Woesebacteria bacterium]QQG47227.1 MAG: DsbA family protein [Candidatus Woesebacteria bacterium]
MEDFKLIIGVGVVTVLIVLGGIFLVSRPQKKDVSTPKPVDTSILIRADARESAKTATPVTIVEFGDFQCPACGYAFPAVEKILSDYDGKVKLIFRHFPLDQHKNAMIASEAAESAEQEGKFFMMYRILYQKQTEWSESSDPMQFFLKYADEIRMDRDKFRKFIDDKKGEERINQDKKDGIVLGVSATPTFFINGVKFEGTPDYQSLKAAVDTVLSTAKK